MARTPMRGTNGRTAPGGNQEGRHNAKMGGVKIANDGGDEGPPGILQLDFWGGKIAVRPRSPITHATPLCDILCCDDVITLFLYVCVYFICCCWHRPNKR